MKHSCAFKFIAIFALSACGAQLAPDFSDLGSSLGNLNKELNMLNVTLNGGYTLEEIQSCQKENRHSKGLELESKAIVNIYIRPNFFSLYTEEHAYTDIEAPSFYDIKLDTGKFRNYTQSFSGKWKAENELRIPFENQPLIFMKTPPKRETIKLKQKNPFAIASYRLNVRQGVFEQILRERYEDVKLNDEERRTVFCAAALNAYYGALIGTNYSFAN